ncbi:MAG: hypothetical protein HYX71_11760 [Opitutae bacterium]|nr:hypothetical protein [Opitutae bacterium]
MKVSHLITALLACAVGGCMSKQDAQQTAGAAAFSVAVIALIPVAPLIEGYHAVSGEQQKEQRSRDEWRAIFDPVYRKRIAMLKSRDPVGDAGIVFEEAGLTFLTSHPEGIYYPGLNSRTDILPPLESNLAAVAKSQLASFLAQLMSNDPSHPPSSRTGYESQVYYDFIRAGGYYMEQFNRAMYAKRCQLNQAEKEPNLQEPTPDGVAHR